MFEQHEQIALRRQQDGSIISVYLLSQNWSNSDWDASAALNYTQSDPQTDYRLTARLSVKHLHQHNAALSFWASKWAQPICCCHPVRQRNSGNKTGRSDEEDEFTLTSFWGVLLISRLMNGNRGRRLILFKHRQGCAWKLHAKSNKWLPPTDRFRMTAPESLPRYRWQHNYPTGSNNGWLGFSRRVWGYFHRRVHRNSTAWAPFSNVIKHWSSVWVGNSSWIITPSLDRHQKQEVYLFRKVESNIKQSLKGKFGLHF